MPGCWWMDTYDLTMDSFYASVQRNCSNNFEDWNILNSIISKLYILFMKLGCGHTIKFFY
jgi:Leu/Phe-tRNA-protein transferase